MPYPFIIWQKHKLLYRCLPQAWANLTQHCALLGKCFHLFYCNCCSKYELSFMLMLDLTGLFAFWGVLPSYLSYLQLPPTFSPLRSVYPEHPASQISLPGAVGKGLSNCQNEEEPLEPGSCKLTFSLMCSSCCRDLSFRRLSIILSLSSSLTCSGNRCHCLRILSAWNKK